MTGPDPLVVAAEHIAFLRRSGVPLVEAAAAIGAPAGVDGWDGLTWAYARCWHEMSQGVAVSREEWEAENSNGRSAINTPAGWLSESPEAGPCGGARFEPSTHGSKNCRSASFFQVPSRDGAVDFRRRSAGDRLRSQVWRAR
jgi:hypothetical protein